MFIKKGQAPSILMWVVFAGIVAAVIIFFTLNMSPQLVRGSSEIATNLPDKIISSVGMG